MFTTAIPNILSTSAKSTPPTSTRPTSPPPPPPLYNETALYGKDFRRHTRNPYSTWTLQDLLNLAQTHYTTITDLPHFTTAQDRLRLADVVNTAYLLAHPYLSLTVPKLRALAHTRDIYIPHNKRKPDLVDQLEAYDAQLTFPFFMDLPPEVRSIIYTFAFLQVHPLRWDTRSRMLFATGVSGPCRRVRAASDACATPEQLSAYGVGNGFLAEHPLLRVSKGVRAQSLRLFCRTRLFPLVRMRFRRLRWLTGPPGGLATIVEGEAQFQKLETFKWLEGEAGERLGTEKVAMLRQFVVPIRVDDAFDNLVIEFVYARTGKLRYRLSWWSTLFQMETDPAGLGLGGRVEVLDRLKSLLEKLCEGGKVGREELLEVVRAMEDGV